MVDEKTFEKTLCEFKSGYGRVGTIIITNDKCYDDNNCDICNKNKTPKVLIDSSEGEYGPGKVCLDCLKQIIRTYGSK